MTSALDLTQDCNLQINLGWNVTNSNIVLRSSAIIFNNEGHATEAIQFQNSRGCGGGVTHSIIGDGKEEFVEDLSINLKDIDPTTKAIVVIINSYAAESFKFIDNLSGNPICQNALKMGSDQISMCTTNLLAINNSAVDMLHVQVNNKQSLKDLMQFYFNPSGPYNALVLCTLYRTKDATDGESANWTLETVMERIHGSSLMELVPLVQESILSKKIIPNLVNAFDSIEFHAAPILPKGQMYTLGSPLIDVKSPVNIDVDIEWVMQPGEDKLHLDASCLAFDIKGKMLEAVYYNRAASQDAAITHHGDELTPGVTAHHERVTVALTGVDPKTRLLLFSVNCYANTALTKLSQMHVTIFDRDRARAILRNHVLSEDLTQTAVVLIGLFRDSGDSWVLDTINQGCRGRSYDEAMPSIRPHVRRLIQLIKAPWDADTTAADCLACKRPFSLVRRRHHCRGCGHIYCDECSTKKKAVPKWGYLTPVRVCDTCFLNN